jgi:MFS transporter, ACS family, hexuronate transporter
MTRNRLRWALVALIAVSSFLNYVDRQTLSLLAGPVQRDLAIDDLGYANLVTAFLVAYTIGNLVTAWTIVRVGARKALALFVGVWSLACAAGGLTQNVWQMGATRFVLGLAETGNWTAAPVIVRQWFQPSQRAMAVGIFTASAMLGGTLAPPLIASIEGQMGWRPAFLITGAVGFIWVAAWLAIYRTKDEVEAVAIEREEQASLTGTVAPGLRWRDILTLRRMWLIAFANGLAAPVWYFYLFWFPKYLTDERGVSLAFLGQTAWAVYLAAGVGALVGGAISGALVGRGMSPPKARIAVMAFVVVAAPVSALNLTAPPVMVSIAIGAFVGFAHFLWTTNLTALTIDLFDSADLGKVLGVMGLFAGGAGVVGNYVVALLVGSLSYRPMFVGMGVAYVLALATIIFILRDPKVTERFRNDSAFEK